MAAIVWDKIGERYYETGVDRGVLYTYDNDTNAYNNGVAWNGLTTVNATPSGAEPSPMYADNIKYANPLSAEEFGGTIEAFTYPVEFEKCDGSFTVGGVNIGQQARQQFGFAWRSKIGSDTEGNNAGSKIHIAYNALAQPSEKGYTTINDSPEAMTLSWTFSTTPLAFPAEKNPDNLAPTSYISIDSREVSPAAFTQLTEALWGATATEPKLLMPWEILAIVRPEGDVDGGEGTEPEV